MLAWDAARHGAADPDSGSNLILHEFAHQLDFENREVDGVPVLATRGCPYSCTYCSSPQMWTTRWYARDPVDGHPTQDPKYFRGQVGSPDPGH